MGKNEVKKYVAYRLEWLRKMPEHPEKAALANLRRGIGRVPGDLPELWGIFLQDLPEEMQRKTGDPTREEWAVYLALTFYALHQQGHKVADLNMNQDGFSLGNAARRLVDPNEEPEDSSVFNRFNALATSSNIRECAHHMRGMIQMLRAKDIPLDYPRLASDLYELQFLDRAPAVRLNWGRDFWNYNTSEEEKEKKDE